jgi:hypothetical protein
MGSHPNALLDSVLNDVGSMFVGDPSPQAYPGESYRSFVSKAMCYNVIRKWIPRNAKSADKAAYDSFILANNKCKDWKLPLCNELEWLIINQAKKLLDDFFHPGGELLFSSYYDLLDRARPGPGVSIGGTGTSFYQKHFSSPLTSTSKYLYDLYRGYIEWHPTFFQADCQRSEKYGNYQVVNASRTSFVPKTSATSRMICVEPTLNMYFQLGLGAIFASRLNTFFGIDLSLQPDINRSAAQLGSKDDSLCTIDLSSASDSVSIGLCRFLLPKYVFETLLSLRSPRTSIGGEDVVLGMISTMGNGFTFPLQTIIFAAITRATKEILLPTLRSRTVVFGDDIVCEHFIARKLVTILDCWALPLTRVSPF